ncbi:unnamed protein product [Ixodes pacificus]
MASRAGDDMDDIRKVLFKEKPQYVIGTACSQKMDVVAAKAGIRFEHDVEVSLASLEKGGHLCFCHCALTWFEDLSGANSRRQGEQRRFFVRTWEPKKSHHGHESGVLGTQSRSP